MFDQLQQPVVTDDFNKSDNVITVINDTAEFFLTTNLC